MIKKEKKKEPKRLQPPRRELLFPFSNNSILKIIPRLRDGGEAATGPSFDGKHPDSSGGLDIISLSAFTFPQCPFLIALGNEYCERAVDTAEEKRR